MFHLTARLPPNSPRRYAHHDLDGAKHQLMALLNIQRKQKDPNPGCVVQPGCVIASCRRRPRGISVGAPFRLRRIPWPWTPHPLPPFALPRMTVDGVEEYDMTATGAKRRRLQELEDEGYQREHRFSRGGYGVTDADRYSAGHLRPIGVMEADRQTAGQLVGLASAR